VSNLQPSVPAAYGRIVRTCLAKDPQERFQSAREVLRALDWVREEAPAQAPAKRALVPWVVGGVLAILGIAGLAFWWRNTRNTDRPLVRLSVDLGPEALRDAGNAAAISPDGQQLLFPVRTPAGKQQLAVRLLSESRSTILPGTDNGHHPFFSPDGQWIGFLAGGQGGGSILKKVPVHGGASVNLAVAYTAGGSWGENGEIFVTESAVSPLMRVPAAGGGGKGKPITQTLNGEVTHRWPQVLPGGQSVLFTSSASFPGMEDATIQVVSLKSGATK